MLQQLPMKSQKIRNAKRSDSLLNYSYAEHLAANIQDPKLVFDDRDTYAPITAAIAKQLIDPQSTDILLTAQYSNSQISYGLIPDTYEAHLPRVLKP